MTYNEKVGAAIGRPYSLMHKHGGRPLAAPTDFLQPLECGRMLRYNSVYKNEIRQIMPYISFLSQEGGQNEKA